ncbi:hypothetical protein QVZ41_13140 [Wenyingzhuangia sp. chi5]|uniref:Uncharacterized protein n=1 Tax=Wenyingzhuangia gilva TaxID=3057677 RepID=A0ABT8VQH6_9FLAO|nr:hypothetical protein [Wenyingzhuangia sp. chi5]MDO3694222.1 hypothetical protein [Wenyingzhuangia sp. chi5]MDO3695788.1 hypothetical protein [Wenyingzhuangia sp. chi5]
MIKYLFLFLITSTIYSQENDYFTEPLNKMNGVFNIPEGYKIEDSNIEDTWCWDGKTDSGIFKTLSKKDESILIGVIISCPDENTIKVARKYVPDWTADTNYINTFKNMSDTINYPVRYYATSYVKEKLNADKAVEYSRGCTRSYKEKYTHNKIVMIGKNDVGFIQVDFLYTDAAKKTIYDEIDRVLPMLVKFKE